MGTKGSSKPLAKGTTGSNKRLELTLLIVFIVVCVVTLVLLSEEVRSFLH